jgi:hypothetical protein
MLNGMMYHTPPGLRWCQERAYVLVIDPEAGISVKLAGLEAAVWKWLSLGYRQQDLLALIQAFLNSSMTEARAQINQILSLWVELGLFVPQDGEIASQASDDQAIVFSAMPSGAEAAI